ncbi:MAG: helix-turn-helix transcriptional regulator [Muribaculaceae bacterium]|nr:helix-turn-helix transcriptional regulator [Muribaculaceae bacterium]
MLHHIAKGKTSREIAAAMFVTDNTIEAHRKSLFAKLGAVNVADLIVKAIDKGYLKKSATQR